MVWLTIALFWALPARAGGALDALDQPRAGTRELSSGAFVDLAPGATVELLRVAGAGRIERVWFTLRSERGEAFGRSLSLRMWWDGAPNPAVEVPLADFFGTGHGEGGEIVSAPVTVRGNAFAAYWPMPFADGARMELRNDGTRAFRVYWQIDWTGLAVADVSPLRFQAAWRREATTQPGRPFVLAELVGRGHLVGAALFVRPLERGWWGEGDDLLEVDGKALRGTGTEDWVNLSWGAEPGSTPFAGVVDQSGRRASLYRWYVNDPVVFQKSLRFAFEQRGRPPNVARADDVSGVALWYADPALNPVPPLPPLADRLAPLDLPEVWDAVGAVAPVDLSRVFDSARAPGDRCVPRARHVLTHAGAEMMAAGVSFRLGNSCGDAASALSIEPEETASIRLPRGGEALYLFLAADGEAGADALVVDVDGVATPLRFGEHLDASNSAWPVPNGRMVVLSEVGLALRGAYVVRLAIPRGARNVTLRGAPGASATVFAMARARS